MRTMQGADAATRDLDSTYLKCLLIDTDVDFAPKAAFRAAMLKGVPLSFALSLDAGAVRCPAVVCLQTMGGVRRCKGPDEPLNRMATDNVLCLRDKVLKSGTAQFNPADLSRLFMNPVVCLKENRTVL